MSLPSLYYLVVIYVFLVLRPIPDIGTEKSVAIFRGMALFVAVCGCLQFFFQFAGVRAFSFTALFPESILIEGEYNVVIPVWRGAAAYKANGMFFLEPSMYSQFVALGLVAEFIYHGSPRRMAVLTLALLCAFSGTGFLVLTFSLVVIGLGEHRLLRRVAKALPLGAIVIALTALAAPEYLQAVVVRATEVDSAGSSGYIRFVSPYVMLMSIAVDPRCIVGFGPGTAERFVAFQHGWHGVNALTKVFIEYGVPGLLSYVALVMSVLYRRDMRKLSIVALFSFIFGGGYLLTPSVLYVLVGLFAWGPGPDTNDSPVLPATA